MVETFGDGESKTPIHGGFLQRATDATLHAEGRNQPAQCMHAMYNVCNGSNKSARQQKTGTDFGQEPIPSPHRNGYKGPSVKDKKDGAKTGWVAANRK